MHVEKYTKSAVGHLLRHYNRTAQNNGNPDIQPDKTGLNYNLCQREQSDFNYYKKRLSQVKCQNRADVKTLCDWIITLPKQNFTEKQEQQFFQSGYDFMSKRYGKENVISAWVHKDEAGQPHLHFCFIPITIDKNKGIEKVSAKEVLTRNELRTIHNEMEAHMEKAFGHHVGILNGATAGGNRIITELKLQDTQKELKDKKEELSALKQVKSQTVEELAEAFRNRPSLISVISQAVKMMMGEIPQQQKQHIRERTRSR